MSVWTHVLGTIRFDNWFAFDLTAYEPDVGIPCTFEDDIEQWDKCNIPCGSEGSLTISKWEAPNETSVARYTITIFGNLRDYDNEQEIIDYFNRITKDQDIRQACFTFEVEGNNKVRTFVWQEDSFVEVN